MKTYTTLIITLLSLQSFSQEQADLIALQKANPTALMMTQESFSKLDKEVQQEISRNVVFIDGSDAAISKDINIEASSLNNLTQTEEELNTSNFIKEWLATHQGVKIVKRSEYMAEETDLREIYDAPHILVLIGEELTKQDILNF